MFGHREHRHGRPCRAHGEQGDHHHDREGHHCGRSHGRQHHHHGHDERDEAFGFEGPFAGPRGGRGDFDGPGGGFGGGFGRGHGRGEHGRGGFGGGRGGGGRGGRFFEHGALRLVLLALLAEKPAHGYELIKAIEDKVEGAYSPSAGVVYPTLTLLEETGQIEVQSAEGGRKLYGVTEEGRATIAGAKTQIEAIFARMQAAGAARQDARDPRVVRAVEGFRLALHLKLDSGLDEDRRAALVKILDQAVADIESL